MTDTTTQAKALRFKIDTDLCSGHGRCYAKAPQWFDCDDLGYGEVKDAVLSEDDRSAAEEIIAICPEAAITLGSAD